MKIVVAHSSKDGLYHEYQKRIGAKFRDEEIPPDFFAEGDSFETIQAVMNAIRNGGGHEVIGVEGDDEAIQKLEKIRPDLVFNVVEGLFGDFRESFIPMICERLGIPYTGSDPLTLAICLNKARTKEILNYYSIPTPAFRIFHPQQKIELRDFNFPAIIKPIAEGSSKGIFNNSVVDSPEQALEKIEESFEKYKNHDD